MLSYSQHQYQTAARLRAKNIKEISGAADHPVVELAHILTGIAKKDFSSTSVDEIPWCASGMNLNILVTNFERNPKATYLMIKAKGFNVDIIKKVFELTQFDLKSFESVITQDTGVKIPAPTWSTAAKSWATWGSPIQESELQKGDCIVLVRKGGNHISLFEARNILTYTLLGYNQSNALQSSTTYLKQRAYAFRRYLG